MVVGAAGNVGAYAIQMAADAGIHVVAIAHLDDEDLLRSLGVKSIIDSSKPSFEQDLPQVDAILDTVGGSTFQRCIAANPHLRKTRPQLLYNEHFQNTALKTL
jgi:NADPH:quinone reductase-like Zn-dependent oxidoreductase